MFEDVYADVTATSVVTGYYDSVNDAYLSPLRSLLPTGRAWTFEDDSEMVKLLTALSYSYCRVAERGQDLLEELDPRTTYELLSDWERVLDLPGDCPTPPTTIAGRRAAVHGKLLGNGDPTPAMFEEMAAGIGYDITVVSCPYHPFVAGSVVGDALWNNTNGGWSFIWLVEYRTGDNDALLEWLIESLCPAHTGVIFVRSSLPTSWTEVLNPKNFTLRSVVNDGNGTWVAVGDNDGVNAYGLISWDDGWTWHEIGSLPVTDLNCVIYDGDQWLAVGDTDGVQPYILTSPNGLDWTQRFPTAPKNKVLHGIAYGDGLWVTVGNSDGVDAYLLTSPDRITWTERVNAKALFLWSVAYGDGLWVAVGQADGADAYLLTSSDGITWTEQANPKNFALYGVVYGGGLFVAVGAADGVDAYILTSTDGTTWTERAPTVAKNIVLRGITYDNGLFVAVGAADGGDAYIVTSPDGITWTEQANPKNFALYGIARNEFGVYVAVGAADGSDAYLVRSPVNLTYPYRWER